MTESAKRKEMKVMAEKEELENELKVALLMKEQEALERDR